MLIMDGVATVGHDLNIADEIFCLEPVLQADAWKQLVSRAYRMGAAVDRPITVRTLYYRGGEEVALLP
eukprot:SAG22_NODE_19298_length_276_cov_0.587571_1_plen_67_part_10